MKKAIALSLCGLLLAGFTAQAADQRALNSLKKLDLGERLEQRCDLEAMDRIARDGSGHKPDKAIAYTFADPEVKGDRMKASGAVFRSKGGWYRLNYDCRTASDHLDIRAFEYHIGAAVPKAQWAEHFLSAD